MRAISALAIVSSSQITQCTMASAEIALVCGLKVWVGCQDRLCVNSDADEALVQWDSR